MLYFRPFLQTPNCPIPVRNCRGRKIRCQITRQDDLIWRRRFELCLISGSCISVFTAAPLCAMSAGDQSVGYSIFFVCHGLPAASAAAEADVVCDSGGLLRLRSHWTMGSAILSRASSAAAIFKYRQSGIFCKHGMFYRRHQHHLRCNGRKRRRPH